MEVGLHSYNVRPPNDSVQLVYNYNNYGLWYIYITIVNGVINQLMIRGHHIVGFYYGFFKGLIGMILDNGIILILMDLPMVLWVSFENDVSWFLNTSKLEL